MAAGAARAVTLTVVIGPLETVSEGVLDSRNVRVSIPAPGGPSAFSVWRGVGNVVGGIFLLPEAPCPVPARWRIASDDSFASDDDFWVYEHLRVVNFLLVHTFMALLVDRVRRYIPSVCLFVS